jgi:hypothetical protein
MVQAWYQGGISVFDFTDSANPVEIAFFDRGPMDAKNLMMAGYWSAYWYDGFIYGTEIARGLDVLKLLPSEHLTQNEIEAASLVVPDRFNAQQQRRIDWPAKPAVARAYLDQLGKSGALSAERTRKLSSALDRGEASGLDAIAGELQADSAKASGRDKARLESLAETVKEIAAGQR